MGGRARPVLYQHATAHTEQVNPESVHTFRKGYTFCDPKGTKPIPGTPSNNWRSSNGVYAKADQTLEDLLKTNCPTCAQRWGKQALEALGDRVRIEPCTMYSRFKSATRFYVDGVYRGMVAIPKGFGEKWSIYLASPDPDGVRRDSYGYDLTGMTTSYRYDADGKRIEADLHSLHKSARDAMLSQVVRLTELGLLPTIAEQADEKAAAEAKRVAENERRATERAEAQAKSDRLAQEREERRSLAREALLAISERAAALGLSNSETAGLLEAITIVGRGRLDVA